MKVTLKIEIDTIIDFQNPQINVLKIIQDESTTTS
jgi:hypothetical protein